MIMPTYRDLYDALAEALDNIQAVLDDVRQECEELRYWGIEEHEEADQQS